jgi:hypothetical protein
VCPPIVARGVLADVAGDRGVERLPAGSGVSRAELQAVFARRGLRVDEGDVVLIRTGIMRDWPDARKMAAVDGSGLQLDGASGSRMKYAWPRWVPTMPASRCRRPAIPPVRSRFTRSC